MSSEAVPEVSHDEWVRVMIAETDNLIALHRKAIDETPSSRPEIA